MGDPEVIVAGVGVRWTGTPRSAATVETRRDDASCHHLRRESRGRGRTRGDATRGAARARARAWARRMTRRFPGRRARGVVRADDARAGRRRAVAFKSRGRRFETLADSPARAVGQGAEVTTRSDTRSSAMPSAFASFASGCSCALVLTHDATFGDDPPARGPLARAPAPSASPEENPNVAMPTRGFLGTLHGAPGETSTTASTPPPTPHRIPTTGRAARLPSALLPSRTPRTAAEGVYPTTTSPTTSRRVPPPARSPPFGRVRRQPHHPRVPAAAMASTKLALTLWARTARPATDALSRYARAGAYEMTDAAWRFLRDTPGRSRRLRVAPHSAAATVSAAHPRPTPPPRAVHPPRARRRARANPPSLRRRVRRFSPLRARDTPPAPSRRDTTPSYAA